MSAFGLEDIIEGDEGRVLFARSERVRIDVRVADAMDHLDFVEQDVDRSGKRAEPAPEVFAEPDRVAQGDVFILVKRQGHDVFRWNPRL